MRKTEKGKKEEIVERGDRETQGAILRKCGRLRFREGHGHEDAMTIRHVSPFLS